MLALLYEASSGHTELALQNFLKLPAKSATAKHYQEVLVTMKRWSTLDIEMASKIYVRDSFRLKNSFVYLSKRFLVETAPLNMNNPKRAAEEVNDWIKTRTNGRISQLIDKGDFYADTSSVVLNSIYFSADWMAKFDKKDTETTPFYVSSAKTVNCPMMRIWGKFYYREDKDLDAQVLQLPFRNAYFNLVIILPRDRTGIVALERTFTKPHFINFTKQSISYSHVDVYLPRFKIEATHELGEPLKEVSLTLEYRDFLLPTLDIISLIIITFFFCLFFQ